MWASGYAARCAGESLLLRSLRRSALTPSLLRRHSRELAGREHILSHEPGKGQQAFAPNRRDMGAHRLELEARRMDEVDRENREKAESASEAGVAAPTLQVPVAAPAPALATVTPPAIAGLRISQPRVAVPGLRVAMPRPQPGSRPPVGRPTPGSATTSTAPAPPTPTSGATLPVDDILSPAPPPAALPTASSSAEPPLLPSHLCSSYFVEPLSWMSPILESGVLAGKLVCPGSKCGAKLGNFDWAGARESSPLGSMIARKKLIDLIPRRMLLWSVGLPGIRLEREPSG